MDLRVTKERFNEHWTYDWVKYVAFIIVAIAFVSLFFSITARRLTDTEELRIVAYSKYSSYFRAYETNDDPRDYILGLELEGSEYLDNEFCFYDYGTTPEGAQAAMANLEAEKEMNTIDLLTLPVMPEYFKEENGEMVLDGGYTTSFDFHVGFGFYAPLDEVIESEIAKGNTAAVELKATLDAHPEYLYSCARRTPSNDYKDYHYNDTEIRPYGIDLNALNKSKVNALVYDYEVMTDLENCNYAMGIRKDCGSYSESIAFMNWFLKNYAV